MIDSQTVLAHHLTSVLGYTLVSVLGGASDQAESTRWTLEDPGVEVAKRLRAADEAWDLIAEREGHAVARAWFTGHNPLLDQSPVMALRAGRLGKVDEAARAFADGTWSA